MVGCIHSFFIQYLIVSSGSLSTETHLIIGCRSNETSKNGCDVRLHRFGIVWTRIVHCLCMSHLSNYIYLLRLLSVQFLRQAWKSSTMWLDRGSCLGRERNCCSSVWYATPNQPPRSSGSSVTWKLNPVSVTTTTTKITTYLLPLWYTIDVFVLLIMKLRPFLLLLL